MLERYTLKEETDKTMFVFQKGNKIYGHIVKNKTDKAPAKLVFETEKFDSIEQLKNNYPSIENEN